MRGLRRPDPVRGSGERGEQLLGTGRPVGQTQSLVPTDRAAGMFPGPATPVPAAPTIGTELCRAVHGRVLVPGDADFDAARPWNLAVEQPVAAVVEAQDTADVSAVVSYASLAGLSAVTQPSGHGASGEVDGVILLRTGRLGGIEVDPERWVVSAYAVAFGGFPLLGSRASDLLGSRASDLLGRRRMFLVGLFLYAAASRCWVWCSCWWCPPTTDALLCVDIRNTRNRCVYMRRAKRWQETVNRSRGLDTPARAVPALPGQLFQHGRLAAGQTVLIHGAAGGVGSLAVQLACDAGARVIGTGAVPDRPS